MEKIIEDLEKDLRNIIEGKPLGKPLREKMGDMVNVRLPRMMIFSLLWASVGYQSALRFAGMKLGRRLGESSGKTEISLVLEEIKKIIEELGGGKAKIRMIPGLSGAELQICSSFLTESVPNVLQNLCFFEEGFIEGYVGGVISKNRALSIAGGESAVTEVNVVEKRCIGLGDDCCMFLIKF
ncbi:MAG: hypothetical protein V1841_00995 [Patescibacteria group bacterium]